MYGIIFLYIDFEMKLECAIAIGSPNFSSSAELPWDMRIAIGKSHGSSKNVVKNRARWRVHV